MENSIDIVSNLGRISFFLILLLSFFLFTVKSRARASNYLLASMLLVMAFDFSGFFMWEYISQRPVLVNLKMASAMLQMPLFYFYVLSVCYFDLKFRIVHTLHAVPFVAFVLLFHVTDFSESILKVYEIFGEVQWLFYMGAIFTTLKRHRDIYYENYARPDSKIFKWLFQFAVLSTVGHILVVAKTFGDTTNYLINMDIWIGLYVLVIITWFTLRALHNPDLFTGIKSTLKPIKSELKNKNLIHPDSGKYEEQVIRLKVFMENQKPYMDYELNLERLANQLQMPEKELSILINHYLGKHFFDFVNTYRINEAKSILADPKCADKTILEILYEVGFNSKSSFYTAFKKATGSTPTQYRKDCATY